MNADNILLIKRDYNRIVPELAKVLRTWDLEKSEGKALMVLLYIDSRFNDFGYLRTEAVDADAKDPDHIGWRGGCFLLAKVEGGKALAEPMDGIYYEAKAREILDGIAA